ncbi:ABC transporter permease [Candidatus Clavichlamydia salmonicola]|uniref:ABC transporter permease n=1 Tax=Candidatus Clavichlamydia salmonicola TaxID=469812 RepID=UPI0018917F14|nr:FtsX-like permease family protein [Candidatus Clavichlamydia salmonicola]
MRFEFSVAFWYLFPRKRRLYSSLMSLFSICVIASVVWLSTVFLSVMEQAEKKWIHDSLILGASLKIVPSRNYFQSYYYKIDEASEASNFSCKNLQEKLVSIKTDPFNADYDEELSEELPNPDLNADGTVKDIVKDTYALLSNYLPSQVTIEPRIISLGDLRVVLRDKGLMQERFIGQSSYAIPLQISDNILFDAIKPLTAKEITFLYNDHLAEKGLQLDFLKKQGSHFLYQFFHLKDLAINPVVLPAHFESSGVLIGDKGHFTFHAADFGSFQERNIPVQVVGFYNPGLSPFGGRSVLMFPEGFAQLASNAAFIEGIFEEALDIRAANISLKNIGKMKKNLENLLQKSGFGDFWEVKAFYDYSDIKPFLSQLHTEKVLLSLVSLMVLAVAASNIVAMLMLLVYRKRKEIGIMYALGVSKNKMMLIFGLCGVLTGCAGSLIGGFLAWITLENLNSLISYVGFIKGIDLLQIGVFEASIFSKSGGCTYLVIVIATLFLSSIAAIFPVKMVSAMNPTELLNGE